MKWILAPSSNPSSNSLYSATNGKATPPGGLLGGSTNNDWDTLIREKHTLMIGSIGPDHDTGDHWGPSWAGVGSRWKEICHKLFSIKHMIHMFFLI